MILWAGSIPKTGNHSMGIRSHQACWLTRTMTTMALSKGIILTRTFSGHIKSNRSIECFTNRNHILLNTRLFGVKTLWLPSLIVRIPTRLGDLVLAPEKPQCLPCSVWRKDTKSLTCQMRILNTPLPHLLLTIFRRHDEAKSFRRHPRRQSAAVESLAAPSPTFRLLSPRC